MTNRTRETGDVGYRAYKKNFLINGDMSVWQRGTSYPTAQNVYTADHVYVQGGAAATAVSRHNIAEGVYALRIVNNVAALFLNVVNAVEDGYNILNGKTVTFSAQVNVSVAGPIELNLRKSATGVGGTSLYSEVINVTEVNYPTIISTTFTLPTGFDDTEFNLLAQIGVVGMPDGAVIDIEHMQLEEGTSATPFEYVSPQEQLAECQRYYEVYDDDLIFGSLMIDNTGYRYIHWPFKVQKRGVPEATSTLVNMPTPTTIPSVFGIRINSETAVGNATSYAADLTADAEL